MQLGRDVLMQLRLPARRAQPPHVPDERQVRLEPAPLHQTGWVHSADPCTKSNIFDPWKTGRHSLGFCGSSDVRGLSRIVCLKVFKTNLNNRALLVLSNLFWFNVVHESVCLAGPFQEADSHDAPRWLQ